MPEYSIAPPMANQPYSPSTTTMLMLEDLERMSGEHGNPDANFQMPGLR